ncbi:hypothetical protein V2J09_022245, partial [Rumex salicifolius]
IRVLSLFPYRKIISVSPFTTIPVNPPPDLPGCVGLHAQIRSEVNNISQKRKLGFELSCELCEMSGKNSAAILSLLDICTFTAFFPTRTLLLLYLIIPASSISTSRLDSSTSVSPATRLAMEHKCEPDDSSKSLNGRGRDYSLKDAFGLFDAGFFSEAKKLFQNLIFLLLELTANWLAARDGGLSYPSVLTFHPEWFAHKSVHVKKSVVNYSLVPDIQRPANDEDIAFMSVHELGQLIKTRKITSLELTKIFLERLKRFNYILDAVVTITEELAYDQAKEADKLISIGNYLGPLHGIPYGLKDIIAVPTYPTTWGSRSFKEQVLDVEAWIYKRLMSTGAVLVAKLASGSLGYDDIWFGGRTRNPWNIHEYSTGSSSGPAACTSAGMVPFAIGSETAGSITYPASRCGVTALRPTFGSVGRTGVMSISESLDKLGPFCRSAIDCAIILDAVRGKDPDDISSRELNFKDPFYVDLTKLTVGYLDDAEMEVVDVLASKGVKVVPFTLNYTVSSVQGILNFTMDVDMLAHFDEWQRSNKDDSYEAQDQWPLELRRARVIPAVDYLQAQRARGKLVQEVRKSFTVDAFIGNATEWEKVCMGNLVGLPVMVVPVGFSQLPNEKSHWRKTITTGIYAPPDRDHIALALAIAYQSETDHHKQRPPIENLTPDDAMSVVLQPARQLRAEFS